jgi:riboflavin synthase
MGGMFTGLVEELGIVEQISHADDGRSVRLAVKAPQVSKDAEIGDSIAVNGCCLTVVKRSRSLLSFDAGSETLSRTNLGRLEADSPVNLERSLKAGDRLGGHLVLGHIDGTGVLLKRRDEGEWSHFTFRVPLPLMRQMASKGSVAIDGVSLTLVDVEQDRFSVALIPHTLDNTTLGMLEVGSLVNIETDVLAKYVERQLAFGRSDARGGPSFAEEAGI